MASVNLNSLTEVQSVGTNDNLLLFNETSNVATRIDYDALADAILNKLTTKSYTDIGGTVPAQIGQNKTDIATLKSRSFTVKTSLTGSDILPAITELPMGTYFWRIDNVTGFPVSGGVIYRITKTNGEADTRCQILAIPMDATSPDIYTAFVPSNATSITWVKQPTRSEVNTNTAAITALNSSIPNISWSNADVVKLTTTSLHDYIDGHSFGVFYAWSSSANWETVGAPTNASYHYLITKTNSTTALVIAFQMTSGTDGIIATKQLYGGNWAAWETRLPV